MDAFIFGGSRGSETKRPRFLLTPPTGAFPPGTRIVLGVLLDPAQPEHLTPFTLIEEPRDGGTWWHATVTQPAPIQQGRVPQESGGVLDPEDDDYLPRPTQLLGLTALRPVPSELPQPFRLEPSVR